LMEFVWASTRSIPRLDKNGPLSSLIRGLSQQADELLKFLLGKFPQQGGQRQAPLESRPGRFFAPAWVLNRSANACTSFCCFFQNAGVGGERRTRLVPTICPRSPSPTPCAMANRRPFVSTTFCMASEYFLLSMSRAHGRHGAHSWPGNQMPKMPAAESRKENDGKYDGARRPVDERAPAAGAGGGRRRDIGRFSVFWERTKARPSCCRHRPPGFLAVFFAGLAWSPSRPISLFTVPASLTTVDAPVVCSGGRADVLASCWARSCAPCSRPCLGDFTCVLGFAHLGVRPAASPSSETP